MLIHSPNTHKSGMGQTGRKPGARLCHLGRSCMDVGVGSRGLKPLGYPGVCINRAKAL